MPQPISVTSPRISDSFSAFSCCFNRYSFAFSICMALSLFWNWDRSFWHCTTIPVGMWVIRIADEVLLICCPPAPLERYVSILKSSSLISTSKSSSISGITSQDTKEV